MRTASQEVLDMIVDRSSGQTLCAGAELGVFDYVRQDKIRTAAEVATEIDLDPAILYPLLRALASLGLLDETPERGFILTERGALSRTDVAGSLRYLAMLKGGIDHRAIWECVLAQIKEGHQLCQPDPSLAATQSDPLKEEPLETEEHRVDCLYNALHPVHAIDRGSASKLV
jgi:hypothetical protein